MSWTTTMVVQGAYMIPVGLLIITAPASFCSAASAATLSWLDVDRDCQPDLLGSQFGAVVGFFYVYVGIYYIALRHNLEYARFSAFGRCVLVPLGNGLLVLKGAVSPKVLLFVLADVLVGAWTASALPATKRE